MGLSETWDTSPETTHRRPALVYSFEDLGPAGNVKALRALNQATDEVIIVLKFK